MEAPSRMFGIQATSILQVGHKPALQELCGGQEAAPWLKFLTGNNGLLAEMEAAKLLTHGAPVMVSLGQKSRLKTMKLQEEGWKVG